MFVRTQKKNIKAYFKRETLLWTVTFFLLVKESFEENLKCVLRKSIFGMVCVCNETYCDTIEPLGPFSNTEFNVYVSSLSGLRFKYFKKEFKNKTRKMAFKIKVNSTVLYQKIYGFGGAFTDSACANINSLKSGAKQNLLSSYFSSKGIEYNLARVPIGGTDFSTRKYSLDDMPNDISLKYFNLSFEDVQHKIPVILASKKLSRKSIHLIGTAWTAPPWMKTNNDYICFGLLESKYYSLWAKYHIRFLEEYSKHGVEFWGLSTGNEPTAGLLPYYSFNCMGWTPMAQSQWIAKNLGPLLKKSKFNKTIIIGVDDQRFVLPTWPTILFKNKETKSLVDGIGVHWYWDNIMPPELLDITHRLFPDKFILYTESCFTKELNLPAVVLGSWDRGEKYASSIITSFNHFISGYIDWNIALDLEGGPTWINNVVDSPIIVNASANEFYKQPMFYAMGHFSKFIPEKSYKIEVKHLQSSNLETVGFLTPENNVVLIILNKGIKPIEINVQVAIEKIAQFKLLSKSLMTLIYKNSIEKNGFESKNLGKPKS